MGEEDRSDTPKNESWSKPLEAARETAHQTDLVHQWYVRTYQPQAYFSAGNCGPGEEDKSLLGLLLATEKNIGAMAHENIYIQSGHEITVDAGAEYRLAAGKEILCTTPGVFEVAVGKTVEILSFGNPAPASLGLAPAPFAPILGHAEEDGGLETIEGVENTRKANADKLEAAKKQLHSKHHSDHTIMKVFGGVFAGVELIMGSFFAFKAKTKMGKATGAITTLGAAALFCLARRPEEKPPGVIEIHAFNELNLYGGGDVVILAGNYAKLEACYRVFIESAGMVSAAATIFTAFGAINAEVMGGITAGLLAGCDAEVNGGRHVIIEAQKGSVFIETHGSNKAIVIEAAHGSHVSIEADGDLKMEAKKEVHIKSEESAVHVVAHKHVLIEATDSSPEVHITAKDGVVTIHAKTIQLQGDDEVSLLVGSSGITVKSDGVMINGSHKFAGGKLDSVTAGALASAKKTFNSMISKLNQQYGQLKDRANKQKVERKLRKTGKP